MRSSCAQSAVVYCIVHILSFQHVTGSLKGPCLLQPSTNGHCQADWSVWCTTWLLYCTVPMVPTNCCQQPHPLPMHYNYLAPPSG
jgi:hypothetical protein